MEEELLENNFKDMVNNRRYMLNRMLRSGGRKVSLRNLLGLESLLVNNLGLLKTMIIRE